MSFLELTFTAGESKNWYDKANYKTPYNLHDSRTICHPLVSRLFFP